MQGSRLSRAIPVPADALHGDRKIRAALHGRVVGHDDAFLAHHLADTRDDTARRYLLTIEAVAGERRELDERRARIEQQADPLARQQFSARQHAAAAPPPPPPSLMRARSLSSSATCARMASALARKRIAARINRTLDDRHGVLGVQAVVRKSSRPISMRRISEVPAPDFIELGVSAAGAGRELVGVAVAAQCLDRLQGYFGGLFGRVENGTGGVDAADAAAIAA